AGPMVRCWYGKIVLDEVPVRSDPDWIQFLVLDLELARRGGELPVIIVGDDPHTGSSADRGIPQHHLTFHEVESVFIEIHENCIPPAADRVVAVRHRKTSPIMSGVRRTHCASVPS